jgi:diacylglycerol O-acyltransferase
MDDLIPLGPEDRAILAIESATVAGHTCKVVRFGEGAPSLEELRARVDERLELAPMLRRRLGGSSHRPGWVPDEHFDVAEHLGPAPASGPVDHAGLLALVARLFEQRLDRARPLWRMDLVPLKDGGSALIWRIHHSLADGTASVRYARALLWDEGAETRMSPADAIAEHERDEARRRAHLAGFLGREYARGERSSPFDGEIGTRREVAFAAVSLAALHDAAKTLGGATINDAVLTIVAGGVARWVRARHGDLGTLRVRVPVSLHHEGDVAANHDSFFAVGVPLSEPDPVARLREVHRETTARKGAHDAQYHERLMHELACAPPLRRLFARMERSPRRFALSVSNVPGPPAPVSVLGAPVVHLHSIAEIGEHHALRVCAVSLAGLLCLGLCADPGVVDRLDVLAEGMAAEARALLAAGGAEQGSAWPT